MKFQSASKSLRSRLRSLVIFQNWWRLFYYKYASKILGPRFYGEWFYAACSEDNRKSHPIIAKTLLEIFRPFKRIVDFGCGDGCLLAELMKYDKDLECLGFEFSLVGIEKAKRRGVPVVEYDFRKHVIPQDYHADIVISLEVAEHLESKHADYYVECLSFMDAQKLIFTAAPPGQGGEGHYNEQPKEYWIAKFAKFRWCPDTKSTLVLQEKWKTSGVSFYYWKNLIVFSRPHSAG